MSTQWFLLWVTLIVSVVCPPPMSAPAAFAVYLVFVAALVVGSLVLFSVWCFKICTELGHPGWLGLLVLCPFTHLVMLGYLARKGRIEKKEWSSGQSPQMA